jgi:hypothetical protein
MMNEGFTNMKTADFRGQISSDGQISVPTEIASQIPSGEKLDVVLRWGASDDESAWRDTARGTFEAAYAEEDSVYEELMDDA